MKCINLPHVWSFSEQSPPKGKEIPEEMEECSLVPSTSSSTPVTGESYEYSLSSAGIIEKGIMEESEKEVATDINDIICSPLALWEEANTKADK